MPTPDQYAPQFAPIEPSHVPDGAASWPAPSGPPLGQPARPVAPTPVAPTPVAPQWDQAGRGARSEPAASPLVTIAAIVAGLLIVGAVGWFTLGRDGSPSRPAVSANGLTGTEASAGPPPGQTKSLPDGWLTYRTIDGAWMFDLPSAPAEPVPLPSSPTVQIVYAKTDGGRIGFGWSKGRLADGTDETATLVELMKGIAASRGAAGIEPVVLNTDRGPVVTATLQLTGGKALFMLRSVDRRPLVSMVIAGLGEPDPAVGNRLLDSFRPGA